MDKLIVFIRLMIIASFYNIFFCCSIYEIFCNFFGILLVICIAKDYTKLYRIIYCVVVGLVVLPLFVDFIFISHLQIFINLFNVVMYGSVLVFEYFEGIEKMIIEQKFSK